MATGRLPSRACGLAGQGADTEVLEIVHRLFPSVAGLEPKRTGSCTTYFLSSAGDLSILAEVGGAQCRLHVGEQTVAVVKRDLPDGEIYFVANPSDSPANFSLEPIPARPHLEIWNPVTGRIGTVSGRLVNSRLDARGSRFIVARQTASLTAAPAGHFGDLRSHSIVLQTLNKPWRLSFKGPDAPPDQPMLEPAYWETVPGCGTFSGEGIYRTVVEYQGAIPVSANLRLPEVHDAAVVFVNGKRAGTAWLPPYNLDISKFIRQGVNELELHVFSSMANRFIGLPDMDIAALRAQYGNRFSAPGEKRLMQGPEHAGIQGQVTVSFETPEGPQ